MKILLIILITALIFMIAAAVEIYRELHHFCVTEYSVCSEKLSGLTRDVVIVFLSDLHCCTYGRNNSDLLREIQNAAPDLILIGGDMLVGKENADYSVAAEFVKKLPAVAPVYYALGNHEGRMKENQQIYGSAYNAYKNELVHSGICFLENSSKTVECCGVNLLISGLELPVQTYKKFHKSDINPQTVEACLSFPAETYKRRFTVLLAHNPAYMDAYLGWGADLVLSGHLHGGLVRIPGLGGIVTPQGFLFPKYCGEMTREGEQTVIVSRGLGTHTLNIRLFNKPELVIIRLKKTL